MLSVKLFGQENERLKAENKNIISFNITRLILCEARFNYERQISPRHIASISAGIQFPVSETFKRVSYIPFYYPVSKGIYIGLGYKYIIVPSKQIYLSPEFYYNYSYYNNKYYRHCTGQDKENYVSQQSMDLSKAGLKLLIGRKQSSTPNKNTRIKFDYFIGIGVQYREEEITIYQKKQGECSVDGQYQYIDYDPAQVEYSKGWWPTLHGGLLIGLSF